VKIGDEQAIPALADLLKSQDAQTVLLAQEALAAFKGNITPSVAQVIPSAGDAGKIAGLNFLPSGKLLPI
jgi:HEAT repeat protein